LNSPPRIEFHLSSPPCFSHVSSSTGGAGKQEINEEYVELLKTRIFGPLAQKGQEGVPESLGVLDSYFLLREDLESIVELSSWPGSRNADPMSAVDSKVRVPPTFHHFTIFFKDPVDYLKS
jgi:replication factor C subunit 1